MDKTLIEYLVNLIVLVPVVLCLIVISLKLSKKGIDSLNMKAYAQVIERVNMSKDTTLFVIKTGDTGCVLVTSAHNTQIVKELDTDEIQEIMKMKSEKQNKINLHKISGLDAKSIINNKLIRKKDDGFFS